MMTRLMCGRCDGKTTELDGSKCGRCGGSGMEMTEEESKKLGEKIRNIEIKRLRVFEEGLANI